MCQISRSFSSELFPRHTDRQTDKQMRPIALLGQDNKVVGSMQWLVLRSQAKNLFCGFFGPKIANLLNLFKYVGCLESLTVKLNYYYSK